MLNSPFHYIYCLPMETIVISIVMIVLVWAAMATFVSDKLLKFFGICAFLLSLAAILYTTVLGRSSCGNAELILKPFNFFAEAKTQPEIYRSMLMNFFVFLPFGLSLPFALPKKLKTKATVTVIAALILSAVIEMIQYYFSIGRAETDDVIMNTLGAAFGCLSYFISSFYRRRIPNEQA